MECGIHCDPLERRADQGLTEIMASVDWRKELNCSICLSTYKDPVNLMCGHDYCRECIGEALDTQGQPGGYFCPQCRTKFQSRPALHKNIFLRNMVENLSPAQLDKEKSGILCTHCIHAPVLAVKSCLLCEVHLCEGHVKVHSVAGEHVLSDPTASPENRKCELHKKMLEYFCIKDSTCVCVYCLIGEHAGHDKELLDEAYEKKKKEMADALSKLKTKKEETEKKVKSLQEEKRKVEEKSAGDTERVSALFGDLQTRLEDLEKRFRGEITKQAKKALHVSDLIQKLERKKDELSRKIHHIEELCNMTDPLAVLMKSDLGNLCDTEEEGDEDVERHNRPLQDGDLDVVGISQTLHHISDLITGVDACFYTNTTIDILLDGNTAGEHLCISNDRKMASWSSSQKYPETPERFQCPQVISSQSFSSGRHCWEVDVEESAMWKIGMCYHSIHRKLWPQVLIGHNNKSWCLQRSEGGNRYAVVHDSAEVQLPADISSNRIRICLDYEAGKLSFHELCVPIRHLHTFTVIFIEPLHAVLWVGSGYVKLIGGAK
ncbi:E3 ubiquitin/ISG15 ligase TRIM25-like [Lithobates pipiens]